jgi:hypothetical protein
MENFNIYKEELNNIHAPEALIMKTLGKVREEEAKVEAEKASNDNVIYKRFDPASEKEETSNEVYTPARRSFGEKYKKPIIIVSTLVAAAAVLILAMKAGIGFKGNMDSSSSDTNSYDSAASSDSAASAASESSDMAAEDSYEEDSYAESAAAADDSSDSSSSKNKKSSSSRGDETAAESTEASYDDAASDSYDSEDSMDYQSIALMGGWSASESTEVTDELNAVFDYAKGGYTGEDYTPIAYLGSQVVSGTNHAFLCKTDSDSFWSIVYVYENLDGVCEITNAYSLDIAASNYENIVLEGKPSGEDLVGGWSMAETTEIDEELKAVIDSATADMAGVSYEPVMVLETQVVAGTNYAVLCKTETSSADAEPYWTVLYIYRNLSDEGQVMSSPVIILGE